VILLYFMSNIALVSYIRRERPQDFKPWLHLVFPVLGSLALLPAAFTTVWPVPAYPDWICFYVFLAWLLAGAIGLIWLVRRRPEALERGTTTLVMKGEMDTDAVDA
jgi:amino acid transporter